MAVSLGDIVVRFLADTTELVAGVEESKGLLGNFGGIAAGVGIAAGAAMVGIGVESVKMAGDFQQSLTQIVTGAGESQKNLGMISDGIKQISVDTATSANDLSKGLYMIESAGYHGATGLDVLKVAAEGARTGNADLETTATAVTTVMHDYAAQHVSATQAMNALIATEGAGKTRLEDLARSMGTVLPLASASGLKFNDVAAAMATMTNAGMTAQRASANLANAIRGLEAPNNKAIDTLSTVGLKAQQVKDALSTQGLGGALQLIEDHVGKKFPAGSVAFVEAMKAIMGGAVGYNVALMVGGQHMSEYEANVKKIGEAMASNAKDVEGFALVQNNFNFQLDRAKMAGNALMITLGQALLPVLTNLLEQVTPMITQFTSWETSTHGVEKGIAAVGAALSVTKGFITGVVTAVMAWQTQTQAIGTTISTLSAILGGLIQAGLVVWTFIKGIGGDFLTVLHPALLILSVAWEGLVKSVQRLMVAFAPLAPTGILLAEIIGGVLVVALGLAIGVVSGLATGLAYFLTGIVTVISGIVQVFTGLVTFIGGILEALQGLFTGNDDLILKGFGDMARGIESIIQGIGTVAIGLFTAIVGTVVGIVSGFVTAVVSFFVTLYNVLVGHSLIPNLINGIIGWFAQLPGRAISAIAGLVSGLGNFFSNLVTQAGAWGKNLIQGFVNGIMSMGGAVGSAVSSVGNTIKNFLGIHSPAKLGPLAEADQWGPNLVKMYATGMQSRLPQIASASTTLATPLAAAGASGARAQDMHIHLEIDGQQIASLIAPHLDRHVRLKFGPRGRG